MQYNEEKIVQKLNKLKFKPNPKWQLEAFVVLDNKIKRKNLFINILIMMSKRKVALLAGGSILSAFMLLLIGVLLVNQFTIGNRNLTAAEKRRIFEQIIKSNSSDVLSLNRRSPEVSSREAGTVAMDLAQGTSMIARLPIPVDYTYRHVKTVYEKGSGFDKCESMQYDDYLYSTESFEFLNQNGESYYKYMEVDNQGILNSYSLSKNTGTSSESIDYRGGNYAVRSKYEFAAATDGIRPLSSDILEGDEPISIPVDGEESVPMPEAPIEETDYESLIEQYFGADADIVEIVEDGGKTYYVVQYSYKTNCSRDYQRSIELFKEEDLSNTIYVQNYVDSTTYQVSKTYSYIDHIDSANLISVISATTLTQNVDFGQVSSNFKFDFNVEIRDIVYPEYDPQKQAEKISNYLVNKNIQLILVNNAILQSIYSNEMSMNDYDIFNYYSDRNFYPAGTKGDEMYNKSLISYGIDNNSSILTMSFMLGNDYLSVEVYNNSTIIPTQQNSNVESTELNLSISGRQVPAVLNKYTTEITPLVLRDDSVSSSTPESSLVKSFTISELIFDYEGLKYKITLPEREDFEVSSLSFSTINTSNAQQMNTLKLMINDVYINPKGVSVEGSGTSGSEVEPISR